MTYRFTPEIIHFFLIFCRLGALFSLLPGVGEIAVPARIRLLLSLAVTFVIVSLVPFTLESGITTPLGLSVAITKELFMGFFVGTIARLIFMLLETAGSIISMQLGLSNAMIFNPAIATQGTLTGTLLTTGCLTIMMSLDLHHEIIRGLIGTYQLLPISASLSFEDASYSLSSLVSQTFVLSLQLCAPFLIVGTMFQFSLGLLNRLMPQLQIYFIAMPLQIMGGLVILWVTIGAISSLFITHYLPKFSSAIGLG